VSGFQQVETHQYLRFPLLIALTQSAVRSGLFMTKDYQRFERSKQHPTHHDIVATRRKIFQDSSSYPVIVTSSLCS
jgi:hypothetical protein